jgi:glycerophosphoryl diester phosphodiesterase
MLVALTAVGETNNLTGRITVKTTSFAKAAAMAMLALFPLGCGSSPLDVGNSSREGKFKEGDKTADNTADLPANLRSEASTFFARPPKNSATLLGRAVLPANTFAAGPPSGEFIGQSFASQPVQGFSSVIEVGDGSYWALSDNGYGSIENSADFNLRLYRVRPDWKTRPGSEAGSVAVESFVELRDPDRKIKFAITNHFTAERVLTGADFDLESFRRAPDGSFWFGEEFGPFLLHTDASGKLLEAPIPLPDLDNPGQVVRAPQNPYLEEASAVRVMNAVRTHARIHGSRKPPVFSPWHVHLIDAVNNPLNRGFNSQRDELRQTSGGAPIVPGQVGDTGMVAANDEVFEIRSAGARSPYPSIKGSGYQVVTWTVNSKDRMLELMALGVNGIISDRPDLLLQAAREFDGNGDGQPDFIGADGLIDINKFDAQGHRGARNLRPENTIPAMEAALDFLMTTLELDCGLTKDNHAVLYHDPEFQSDKSRRGGGVALPYFLKDVTLAEIQDPFALILNDGVFRGPSQSNDPMLSPASKAYFEARVFGRPFRDNNDARRIYAMPTLAQVFDFVEFYVDFYAPGGAGRTGGLPAAEYDRRWRNAQKVRFNIETKLNPRLPHATKAPNEFVATIGGLIQARGLEDRADIQSFDFRTLLQVHQVHPEIRTVFLFGDFSIYPNAMATGAGFLENGDAGGTFNDDGTNFQPRNINAPVTDTAGDTNNTDWMAGLYWPYRRTVRTFAARSATSGGFEGMALSQDGGKLYPMLERPLTGAPANTLYIHEFDIATRAYTGARWRYPFEPNGNAIGEFTMFSLNKGLVIERDGTQGDLGGFKKIFLVALGGPDTVVRKAEVVDLMSIRDPRGISDEPAFTGDVGLGNPFAFPFVTIESVFVLGHDTIGVVNDNNYPFSIGRHVGTRQPDDNEFILLRLAKPLTSY